jgi:hypothetical protein
MLVALPAIAEDRLLVSSAFGDSSIVAPVVRYEVEQDDGTSWAAGLSGWTIDGEWSRPLSATRALRFTADATPLNAHNSDRIYVNGDRAPELEYDNASYRARGGLRFTPSSRHTTDVFLVALQESVEGVSDALEQRWSDPYAGLELAHTYSVRNASSPLIASFDGIDVTARLEAFSGEENFSRVSLIERAGRSYGRIHLRQSLALLHGSSLDVVNRFVVGGSWDSLGGTAVYGLRYGELRLRRALIASGGADVRVAGNWRVGVRGSYVDGDEGRSTYGHALNVTTTWRTVGANFGVGFPEEGDTIVYAALIVPLYKK